MSIEIIRKPNHANGNYMFKSIDDDYLIEFKYKDNGDWIAKLSTYDDDKYYKLINPQKNNINATLQYGQKFRLFLYYDNKDAKDILSIHVETKTINFDGELKTIIKDFIFESLKNGGLSNKVRVLGRMRKVTKVGRTSYVEYKGGKIALSEARRIEKELRKKK